MASSSVLHSEEDRGKDYRVLSIQSHVVSGYVGNRSAVFPLQVLGFDVDFINTVQFSNHMGYPFVKGNSLDEMSLYDLFVGLKENGLDHCYTHLLTGFVRSKSVLLKLAEMATEIKRLNPTLLYVCDPVMGDLGKMYVSADVLEIYRDVMLPLADVITPNQFEAELLTGIEIHDSASALRAMEILHERGPPTVIISSSDLGDDEHLVAYASSIKGGEKAQFQMSIPRFPASFNGTGDLFAALFLAWYTKSNANLQYSFEATVSTLHAVLKRTMEHKQKLTSSTPSSEVHNLELRLIQSKKNIEVPTLSISSRKLS